MLQQVDEARRGNVIAHTFDAGRWAFIAEFTAFLYHSR